VDVLVMEANRTKTRSLAAAISSNGTTAGINTQIQFTPRNPVLLGGTVSAPRPPRLPARRTATQELISLSRVSHISTNDFSITMPGALLQATMADSATKVLQSPQVRAASGQKASLRIGEEVPHRVGRHTAVWRQRGELRRSVSELHLRCDIASMWTSRRRSMGTRKSLLKIVLEISSQTGNVDIGGISQPIIGTA